jgi:hypothetical protein
MQYRRELQDLWQPNQAQELHSQHKPRWQDPIAVKAPGELRHHLAAKAFEKSRKRQTLTRTKHASNLLATSKSFASGCSSMQHSHCFCFCGALPQFHLLCRTRLKKKLIRRTAIFALFLKNKNKQNILFYPTTLKHLLLSCSPTHGFTRAVTRGIEMLSPSPTDFNTPSCNLK